MTQTKSSRLSARRSTRRQRLTSLILLPSIVWLAPALPRLPGLTYETLIAWLMHSWNGSLLIIFIIVATHHSLLGLQAVMDDYLHAPSLKRLCVSSTRIVLILMGLAGAGAIIKIIMTHPS